jgi:hypothetical protein
MEFAGDKRAERHPKRSRFSGAGKNLPGVIPKPRAFTSGARDLARIAGEVSRKPIPEPLP